MKAFNGDPEIKQKYIDRVIAHQKADEIINGVYWQNGKGCAVGCTIHSGNHRAYEEELGIPMVLARLEDSIFEGLPNDIERTWPLRFLESINVGADLSKVWPKFAIWLLTDKTYGVVQFAKPKGIKELINNVSNLYLRSLKEKITKDEWSKAADAANAASVAYAADAAYVSAYAAFDDDRINARIRQSEKLLELLSECE